MGGRCYALREMGSSWKAAERVPKATRQASKVDGRGSEAAEGAFWGQRMKLACG